MAETALSRFADRKRTTFCALRVEDPADLDPIAREVGIAVWQRRHANEQASVELAERMHRYATAFAVGESDVLRALDRFADDERRHVEAAANVLGAFDAPLATAQALRAPSVDESPLLSFSRDVVVGLVVCESVSAARFAVVRAVTDIPAFRKTIDAFLRDEIAHAALGFHLLASVKSLLGDELGGREVEPWLVRESMTALRELETVVGLDGARKGLPTPRPQPSNNPGVVEPNLDAHAFYRAVEQRILPRLESNGVGAMQRWKERFDERRALGM